MGQHGRKYPPHDYQLEGVRKALDVLAITPTGSGQSGFLGIYLLKAISQNLGLFPEQDFR